MKLESAGLGLIITDFMDQQLDRIRRAYDLTVEQYERGVDPLENVLDDLKNCQRGSRHTQSGTSSRRYDVSLGGKFVQTAIRP